MTARRELLATFPLAMLGAVLSPNFNGFVGRKALNMSDNLLALLVACNLTGLLVAGVLVGFLQQRRKIPLISRIIAFVALVLLTIAGVGLLPLSETAAQIVFVVQIGCAQVGMALVTTLRPTLWRANYPSQHRGKLVVILSLAMSAASALVILILTGFMDGLGWSFHAVYLSSGLCGLLAAWLYSRLRIHRERQTLARLPLISDRLPQLLAGWTVLRDDARYREFMTWQMLSGLVIHMVNVVVIVIVADVFESSWVVGGSLLAVVPILISGVSGLFWARHYDRSNVLIMRQHSAVLWAVSRLALLAAVLTRRVELLLLCCLITGVAMGVGQLAWRLGHMEFAPAEKDSLYMGVHISLTGLRGAIAPFLGMWLYRVEWLGPHGMGLITLAAVCNFLAAWGFARMNRQEEAISASKR